MKHCRATSWVLARKVLGCSLDYRSALSYVISRDHGHPIPRERFCLNCGHIRGTGGTSGHCVRGRNDVAVECDCSYADCHAFLLGFPRIAHVGQRRTGRGRSDRGAPKRGLARTDGAMVVAGVWMHQHGSAPAVKPVENETDPLPKGRMPQHQKKVRTERPGTKSRE